MRMRTFLLTFLYVVITINCIVLGTLSTLGYDVGHWGIYLAVWGVLTLVYSAFLGIFLAVVEAFLDALSPW